MILNIDWQKVLFEKAAWMESKFPICIGIEKEIVLEIQDKVSLSIKNLNIKDPNVSKIAGLVTFWIRKLKPIVHHPEKSVGRFVFANELVAILVGLSICREYSDDYSKRPDQELPTRVVLDWVRSMRYHSHSPHSSMISFELIGSDPKAK